VSTGSVASAESPWSVSTRAGSLESTDLAGSSESTVPAGEDELKGGEYAFGNGGYSFLGSVAADGLAISSVPVHPE
jgi:hypothetical protein